MEWSEFAQRFALELAGLDRDTILIVRERDESRHYVQAMREPDRLYAESVSNNFLDGPLVLTPADEEILSEAGWRPPAADWTPANWWTELPPESGHGAFTLLADMMVTALRDVQGIRRPLDLVYESFHRHGSGLIELSGFGIAPADPSRITSRRLQPAAAPVPGLPLEDLLAQARRRGDHVGYFDLLLDAELLLPASGPAVEDPALTEYSTVRRDGETHLLAFTSPGALAAAGYAGLHRRTTFAALTAAWPDPAWQLTVNSGGASEISLDAAMMARLETMRRPAAAADTLRGDAVPPEPRPDVLGSRREDAPAANGSAFGGRHLHEFGEERPAGRHEAPRPSLADAVLAAPAPAPLLPAAGRPMRLPHGARMWAEEGVVAVYDAPSGRWNATRVAADGG